MRLTNMEQKKSNKNFLIAKTINYYYLEKSGLSIDLKKKSKEENLL